MQNGFRTVHFRHYLLNLIILRRDNCTCLRISEMLAQQLSLLSSWLSSNKFAEKNSQVKVILEYIVLRCNCLYHCTVPVTGALMVEGFYCQFIQTPNKETKKQ